MREAPGRASDPGRLLSYREPLPRVDPGRSHLALSLPDLQDQVGKGSLVTSGSRQISSSELLIEPARSVRLRCGVRFYLTVFLAPASQQLVVPSLTAALTPFDYNDYLREPFDPDAAWDRWQLPQRNTLPLRSEHIEDARALRVGDGAQDEVVVAAPKGIVDFDAIRQTSRDHAAGVWDAWADLIRAHPGTLARAHFEQLHDDPGKATWLGFFSRLSKKSRRRRPLRSTRNSTSRS